MEAIRNKSNLLLVEDDNSLGQILEEYLNLKGYNTSLRKDGESALSYYENNKKKIDACIVDIMLPKLDGYSLVEHIRKSNKQIPIIFLTAKSLKEDILEGFRKGGDDYIKKPFSMEELLERIKSLLKRATGKSYLDDPSREIFKASNFTFNSYNQELKYKNEQPLVLTSKESALLRLLCLHKNSKLDRSFVLKEVWLDDNYFNARSMDVYVTKLRRYLRKDKNVQIINIHGQGYKLVETI